MKRSPTEAVLVVEVNGGVSLVLTMSELQIIQDEMRYGHQAIHRSEPTRKPPSVQRTAC